MDKTEKNIGQLTNRILVFGGVYSNLQSLEKMQSIAKDEGIPSSNILCTGDIVGYCAQPEECIQLIEEWGVHTILGNVEVQLRDGEEDCGCDFDNGSRCDIFSKRWYPYAQENVSLTSILWLEDLPDHIRFTFANKEFIVVHGSYHETSGYVFKSSPWSLKASNFIDSGADVIVAGHCGLPFIDQKNDKLWFNAGVIGMPANDGTTRVWYLIIEEGKNGKMKVQRKSFEYDYQVTAKLMRAEKLPKEYALTLETGLWDNCEILPEVETGIQGLEISNEHILVD